MQLYSADESRRGESERGTTLFLFIYNNVIVATIVAIIFLGPHWLVLAKTVNQFL